MAKDISPADIGRLTGDLERLKFAYEQYFMGAERREPLDERRRVAREINTLAESWSNNTALRFQAATLRQRLTTYENYWNRVAKEIEAGTYRRHQFKVQLHVGDVKRARAEAESAAAKAAQEAEAAAAAHVATARPTTVSGSSAGSSTKTGTPVAAEKPAAPAATAAGTKPSAAPPVARPAAGESVIEQYRRMQRQAGLQPISADKLAQTLRQQEDQIKKKFGASRVEFRVVVEDGKPKLKARPIK